MPRNTYVQAISTSKVRSYLTCPYMHFLDTQIREANIPMTAFTAKQYWLKDAMRRLFPDEQHVGPDLADIEDLRGEELAEYLNNHSPEAFGNAVENLWRMFVIDGDGRVHGREVAWRYHDQWETIAHQLNTAGVNFYKFLMEEGPPILALNNKDVAFYHDADKFVVRFDAVRKGPVVCKYGGRKMDQRELDTDWLATLQTFALSTLASQSQTYRRHLGVRKREWQEIVPEITYRYYNLARGEIMESTRTIDAIPEMLKTIEEAETGMKTKPVAKPTHKNCSACRYNVLDAAGEVICKKRNPKVPTLMLRNSLTEKSVGVEEESEGEE
ncbi:MAG: hypothetical protein AABX14_04455 [Candidatus Aenigmatarchaeota archaeon]